MIILGIHAYHGDAAAGAIVRDGNTKEVRISDLEFRIANFKESERAKLSRFISAKFLNMRRSFWMSDRLVFLRDPGFACLVPALGAD